MLKLELLSPVNRNRFIEDSKLFIYNTAYKICKRKLDWKNDDELSVALVAFNKACDSYNQEKGEFYSFAKVIIRNSLVDHFRKAKNNPYLAFESNEDEELQFIDIKNSLTQYQIESENKNRIEEIALLSIELSMYKLDFDVLANSSPSHKDTRDSLLNLAMSCIREETILKQIKEKKLLPVKEICLLTGTNRKFVEKWRRYILTLIIILSSEDYPYIKSYLNIKVGEKNA